MLDHWRKRLESLLSGGSSISSAEDQTAKADAAHSDSEPDTEGQNPSVEGTNEIEQALLARKEAQRREQRLILSERIHNRAAALANGLRTELVQALHDRLASEVRGSSLNDLLQVTLDAGFTARLDAGIDTNVSVLLSTLHSEFGAETAHLFPKAETLAADLKAYRDESLRKHVLEQVEVLALPASAQAFPDGVATPEELKTRIAAYWTSCREALERFFRSVEMVLLDAAREGIRLDSTLIRQRLVAAQYRNGYHVLDGRFRAIHSEVASFQMSAEQNDERRTELDRRVVDEVIVPLAYFIRERVEPEPRDALRSRAELLTEVVERFVMIPEPFHQTAEAMKPVLRKSIEQARGPAVEEFPYLRAVIESLNPQAIQRTTALLKVFSTLVQPDVDEVSLEGLEHVIRLNRPQHDLNVALKRYRGLAAELAPLERIHDDDARQIAQIVEQAAPPRKMVEDLFLTLDYLPWPVEVPGGERGLLQLVLAVAANPDEFTGFLALYEDGDEPVHPELRARLASLIEERVLPTSIGYDPRIRRLRATPAPVDLDKALKALEFEFEFDPNGDHPGTDRPAAFRRMLKDAVSNGDHSDIVDAMSLTLRLRHRLLEERIALGAASSSAAPYVVDVWRPQDGAMLGLVGYDGPGFGTSPITHRLVETAGEDPSELEDTLKQKLLNQARVLQAFYQLFESTALLSVEKRRALPKYLKTLYERAHPNRHVLLSRIRFATELTAQVEGLAKLVAEADEDVSKSSKAVFSILSGLSKRIAILTKTTEDSRSPQDLDAAVNEYHRTIKYLNTAILHSINPWLERQTSDLTTTFEFNLAEVTSAVKRYTSHMGIEWDEDVENFEAHGIRGTTGCRGLLKLADGSFKVVLLNYDRRAQSWKVRHMGPRVADVVRSALERRGRKLPEDYDEKFEQPTFHLDQQTCRFLLVKRGIARVEATLVLDASREENPWRIAFLRHNETVFIDGPSA